jgi:hypothetical protein
MANRKNRTPHFLASHAHLGSQNTFCTGSTSSVPSLYQVCAVFACPSANLKRKPKYDSVHTTSTFKRPRLR